jgi:extracellular elastinolytic metalloproteinase
LFDEDTDLTPIVIVDRGECTFVTKVRNIEKMGVKMAIIVDDKEENTEDLIMADDGTGHSVNIPSFIIRKKEGDLIKEEAAKKDKKTIYVKAELEMVHPDNRVEYELWYSSVLDLDYMFINDMANY